MELNNAAKKRENGLLSTEYLEYSMWLKRLHLDDDLAENLKSKNIAIASIIPHGDTTYLEVAIVFENNHK